MTAKESKAVAFIESYSYEDYPGHSRNVQALVWADHPANTPGHKFTPLVPQKELQKAVQQLAETNRQLQTGLSIGGRQFYGTPDDIAWLQQQQSALHAAEAELGELRRRVGGLAGRMYSEGYTGHDAARGPIYNFANELKLLASDGGADGDNTNQELK